MHLDRRGFLLSSAAAVAGMQAIAKTGAAEPTAPQTEAALKLSSQLSVIPAKLLEEKLAKMEQWGFDAVEVGNDIVGKEEKYLNAIAQTKLKVSAICLGSLKGGMVSPDPQKRQETAEMLKRYLDAAAQLKAVGVIHVPAFNAETTLSNQEIRKIVVDTYPAIGEYAVKVGTRILLEPLNRKEAFFLRQLADGAAICRDCNSPGICLMGDFYHMGIEEPNDLGAFISGRDYLHHIHLASRSRVLPGQDERSYVEGFRGLKLIGYHDYCSFECGVQGDRDIEIPKSMAFLRDQWAQAVV